jgi:drug/metabolite transporter (DMT)-like permease
VSTEARTRVGGMSRRSWFLFVTMSVLWGLPYFFIKVAVEELSPVTIVFVRTGLSALVLLPLAWRSMPVLRPRLRPLLALSLFEITIPFLLIT